MFNIGVDVNLNVKDVVYPIYFDKKNICVHCGAEGALMFVDKFGNKTRKEIHAFDHLECTRCGRIYSIKWQVDDNTQRMYPTAVDPSIKQEFFNLIQINKLKEKADKNI
jgi:hypothetical protein